jgi:hypothetical protein
MTDIKNHMRELMERAIAELPAEPNNNDAINSILGSNTEAQVKAETEMAEYKLLRATKLGAMFLQRHGRSPRSWHELMADPVCKKLDGKWTQEFADLIMEGIRKS